MKFIVGKLGISQYNCANTPVQAIKTRPDCMTEKIKETM